MLGKLLKYDIRAGAKLLLPASLFVIATTILGTIAFRFAFQGIGIFPDGSVAADIYESSMYMIFGMSIFALCIYAAAATIMVVVHYYRNFFTDEGYLTFTLPVSTSDLLTSKLLAAVLWLTASGIVVVLCILTYVTFGGAPEGQLINTEFYKVIEEGLYVISRNMDSNGVTFVIEIIFNLIVSLFLAILQAFLAISIGSLVAKKHKILASVGFYYLINMILSTVSTIFMGIFFTGSAVFLETATYDVMTGTSGEYWIMHLFMIVNIVFSLIVAITEYLVNRYILKNKLNIQ